MKKHINITQIAIFTIGLATSLCLFLSALTYENMAFDGYEIIFGTELLNINPFNLGTIASAYLPFSLLAMMAYLLPLVAGILILISKSNLFYSLVIFLISTFLLALLPNSIHIIYTVGGSSNALDVSWSVGTGLLAALILSSLGTISNLILLLKTSI
jgi:hypothetical protein